MGNLLGLDEDTRPHVADSVLGAASKRKDKHRHHAEENMKLEGACLHGVVW